MEIKKCCFIGHRKIDITEELRNKVKALVEDLIINFNVQIFLLGSRSDFNELCHSAVSELKRKYQNIKIVAYTCRSETCILESERAKWEKIYSNLYNKEVNLLCVDEEFEHKTKYTSGKASYIERNEAMINDSDVCIFYYDENYQIEKRKCPKSDIGYYQPKSGTLLAYNYAMRKNKKLINVFLLK